MQIARCPTDGEASRVLYIKVRVYRNIVREIWILEEIRELGNGRFQTRLPYAPAAWASGGAVPGTPPAHLT